MQNLRIIIILCTTILFVVAAQRNKSGDGVHQLQKNPRNNHSHQQKLSRKMGSITNDITKVKVPGVIRRKYEQWSKAPKNLTVLYYSIPVKKEHVKDDIFLLTASFRKTKATTLSVRLWMEFPDIKKSKELKSALFLIDFIPVIDSQDMVTYNDACSVMTIVGKPLFPDGMLEMKYEITSLYQACQVKGMSPFFKFKIRFYPLDDATSISLAKDKVDIFLIFKEHDDVPNIVDLLPNSDEMEPLHYETLMRKVPHVKSFPFQRPAKICSLRPFTFSFDVTGWKDVIAPKEYQSNKCQGRCAFPLPQHVNYTNFAIIKAVGSTIYKEMKNPCCVAQDLAPISMLVCDKHDEIVLKTQKDMIAKSCKCA